MTQLGLRALIGLDTGLRYQSTQKVEGSDRQSEFEDQRLITMDWQRLFYRQVLPTEGAGDGGVANGATTTSTTGLSASGTAPSTAGGSKDSETASGRPQAIQFQLADNLRDRIFTLDPSRPPLISWKRTNATQIEEITWFGTSSSGSGSYRDIAVVRGTSVPLLDYDGTSLSKTQVHVCSNHSPAH